MNRCLELARLGLGKTYPNPMVGSVIVHQDKIIGEGWHEKAGCPHAEVNAVDSVQDKTLLKASTIYVNLEPCAHFGKTPPCAQLIINHEIPRVVIGCVDPFSKVSGKGIEMLRNAGVEVKVDVLKEACEESHKRFFTFHVKHRPYIILKWAESKDGFIAPKDQEPGKPLWISSAASKKLVHRWRTEEASILVGTRTVELDNPMLTARLWKGNPPLRLVIDKDLRLPDTLHVFDDSVKTLVFTEKFKDNNTSTEYLCINFNILQKEVMDALYQRNIHSVIIEGGKQTLQSFIDIGLWDEARVFIGSELLSDGLAAPQLTSSKIVIDSVSSDQLMIHYK